MSTRQEAKDKFNKNLRDEWVKAKTAEYVKEGDDPFMAQLVAEQDWSEYAADAKHKEKIEKLEKEALGRNQKQQAQAKTRGRRDLAASLQNKNLEDLGNDIYRDPATGDYYKITGPDGAREAKKLDARLAQERVQAHKHRDAAANKVRQEKLENVEKYIKDSQSLMFNKMFDRFGDEDFPISGAEKIYRVQKRKNRSPSFVQSLNTRGLFSSKRGSFLQATPAQLGSLMPLLRFYLIDEKGTENEIYFSDKISATHLKKIAELKGKSIDEIVNYNPQGGGETGISSFSWNYNNKHEGDYIIEADLQLYFGSLVELANVEYLKFLGATGNVNEISTTLKKNSDAARKSKTSTVKEKEKSYLDKLKVRIDEYQKVLKLGNSGLRALSRKVEPRKRENVRELKVVVGWSLPEGNDNQLQALFSGEDSAIDLKSFREEVKKTQTAIFLNLVDYNVEFTQEGPTTLSLKYVGSSDNYLATDKSDTFGSNNFESDIMYEPTVVSMEGILEKNNKLSDSRNEAGATTSSGTGVDPSAAAYNDPYLKKLLSGKAVNNRFGERTVTVQLAGLRYAQELVSLKIKLLEAKQTDPESTRFKKLRILGQYIVLLYNRALRIRLRDMYSDFLNEMLKEGEEILRPAFIELTPKGESVSVKLTTEPKKVTKRQNVKDAQDVTAAVIDGLIKTSTLGKLAKAVGAGEALARAAKNIKNASRKGVAGIAGLDPNSTTISVNYFFLGDLIKIMMRKAGLDENITFLLGNFDDVNGNSMAIYKIPITLDSFADFFYNRIVASKVTAYPFRTFFNDFLNYVARMMNESTETSDRISFEYTMFPSYYKDVVPGDNKIIDSRQIRNIRKNVHDPLSNVRRNKKYQSYYALFARRYSIGKRVGNLKTDQDDGIFHYALGSDRGLAKNYSFSRQDTQFFQEMLIESNNPSDKIQALFLPQNVEIDMYGNGIHRNGDMVYVDTRAALGEFASQVLGIGGYYRVVRATHNISNRGYTTKLSCVFELRAGRKEEKNEAPIKEEK